MRLDEVAEREIGTVLKLANPLDEGAKSTSSLARSTTTTSDIVYTLLLEFVEECLDL